MNCYETVFQKKYSNYTWAWLHSKYFFFFFSSWRILIQKQKLALFGTERVFPATVYSAIPWSQLPGKTGHGAICQNKPAWISVFQAKIHCSSAVATWDVTEADGARPLQLGNSNYPKISCSLPYVGAQVSSGQNVELSWNFITLIPFWCSTGFDWLSIQMLNCNCFVYLDLLFVYTAKHRCDCSKN